MHLIMKTYTMRRKKKTISSQEEIFSIINQQSFMTIALCANNEPYLVSLDYAFDESNNCFYFHCAQVGKKIDYIAENDKIWGQIIEDHGYIQGTLNHSFRSIHFQGNIEFIDDEKDKKFALSMMINKYDDNPLPLEKENLNEKGLMKVKVGKIMIKDMTGKNNIVIKKE